MDEKQSVKKIAILTHNKVGKGQYDNGVIEGKNIQLLLAQEDIINETKLTGDLTERINLAEIDHVYAYVKAGCGEKMIRLLTNLIAPEKITYFACSCDWDTNCKMIKLFGHQNAEVIQCECGGRQTLAGIVEELLK